MRWRGGRGFGRFRQGCPDELHRTARGDLEQQHRDQQQVGWTERHGKQRGERGPQQRAGSTARRDETKQPPASLVTEALRHEPPEHRHHEQVENADPDEKRARDMNPPDIEREHHPEAKQRHCKEAIHPRDEATAGKPGDQRAKARHGSKHHEKCCREQPLQIGHTRRHPHFIAQGPQDVVGAQEKEEVCERPAEGPAFTGFDIYNSPKGSVTQGWGHGTCGRMARTRASKGG